MASHCLGSKFRLEIALPLEVKRRGAYDSMDLICVTERVDDFFWPDDEIFKPRIEAETLELLIRDRGIPIFELFPP